MGEEQNNQASSNIGTQQPESTVTPLQPSVNTQTETPASPAQSQPGPMTASSDTPKQSKNPFKNMKKTTLVILIVALLSVLFASAAGAYYTVVLPNNPEYLWKKSMQNSAKAMNKAVTYQQSRQNVKGMKITGDFKGEFQQAIVDGSFNGKSYESNAEFKADLGVAGSRMNLELLINTPQNANNPDIYVRVQGLGGLSSLLGTNNPEVATLLNSVNNQWYVIDHTLLDQMAKSSSKTTEKSITQMTPEDQNKILAAIASATNEYVLSAQSDKAVLVVRQNVGVETVNGRKMYHYKVSVNKPNFKKYLSSLKDALKNSELSKVAGFTNLDAQFDQLNKSVDNINDTDTADIWVDMSTKLIRSVKFTEKGNEKNYLQVSLNYNGGSVIPLELIVNSDDKNDKANLTMQVSVDTSTNQSTATAKLNVGEGSDASNFQINMKSEENTEEIKFTKPADAKSIYELVGSLMGGTSASMNMTDDNSMQMSTPLGNFDL